MCNTCIFDQSLYPENSSCVSISGSITMHIIMSVSPPGTNESKHRFKPCLSTSSKFTEDHRAGKRDRVSCNLVPAT